LCNASQHTLRPLEIEKFLLNILTKLKNKENLREQNKNTSPSNLAEEADLIADLGQGNAYIVLGGLLNSLPNYGKIMSLALEISDLTQAKFGFLIAKANEVGAELVNFLPYKRSFMGETEKLGLNAMQMLQSPRQAYLLLNTELEWDTYNSSMALGALKEAKSVIVMSPFINEAMKEYADVILPITPFTETAGSYVNMEGKWQKFNGTTKPLGESKPAWKVIRVLANCLKVNGFEYESVEEIRLEVQPIIEDRALLNNRLSEVNAELNGALEAEDLLVLRITHPGIYGVDSLTRRSLPLQETVWAKKPILSIASNLAKEYNLSNGGEVKITQCGVTLDFKVIVDDNLASNMVLFTLSPTIFNLGGRFDPLELKI
jgi:NADH-quinone oxidoreductase subunit G